MTERSHLIARLRGQMSRGQLVLFTGAGFSHDARNRGNEGLPSSTELRNLLLAIAYPGESVDEITSLGDAFAIALARNRGAVQRLFEVRLSVAPTLPSYYRRYLSMPWHRMYTLNIDDLETAAKNQFDLPRHPVSISATTLTSEADRRPRGGPLEVVHLNGMLGDSPDFWTFSEPQYGGRAATPDSWYTRCAVDLRARPVIYVGSELRESSLWQHIELRRLQGVESEINPPGSILVTPTLSRARADMLASFSVEWVQMTAAEFAETILAELVESAAQGLSFLRTYDEAFGRVGIPLVSELIGERPDLETEFLRGEEPQWSDLLQGRACVRSHDAELARAARAILHGDHPATALAIAGTAGAGKTTALMRLAIELSNEGTPVLWVDRKSAADTSLLRRRLADFEDRVVLAIDDAEVFGGYLGRFIRDVVPQRRNLLVAFVLPSGRLDELQAMLARTGEAALFEHVVPNLTDDDVDALLSVLDRHKRLGILAGASEEARRRALRDKCGRQLIVAMIEATTGERFEQKLQDELLELPGLQRFIYSVLCLAGQEKHYLTRDEVLLAAQGLPGGDPFEALTLLVRRHVASAPPPGTQYRPRHHVIAQVVVQALGDRGQLCDPLKALVYALASKADPLLNRRDRVWRLLARLINHGFLLNLLGDVSEIRSIYSSVEALLGRDHHYWLQRGSLEVENGDLRRAEQFLSQARSLAPDDYKVDTEYGYLLMRKAIAEPQHRQARTWVEEATQLLEGVISTRGDTDYYPFHVLGAQGLSWARRVTTTDERRRLLNYFLNLVEQGTKKHPWRRDLDQLRIDIQRDLLLTAAATEGPFQ